MTEITQNKTKIQKKRWQS